MVLPGALPAAQPSSQPATPSPTPKPPAERWKWGVGVALCVAGALLVVRLVVGALGVLSANSYTFMATQNGQPVTWNHCHAIRYQVNPKGAPPGWEDIVDHAIDDVEEASGFVFADRGTTTKTQLILAAKGGASEWEPVLIVWSDRYQDGALGGGVIGRGGPGSVYVDGLRRFVVGQVSLDTNVTDAHDTQMVLEHELGHVLGLGHASDPGQLMYAGYHGQDGFGDGDRNGFKRLHDIPCD